MLYALIYFVGGAIWSYYLRNIFKKTTNLDKLKNALLTLSLIKLRQKDISNSLYYTNYDGSKLPPLNGSDLNTTCFTYILDIHEFKNSNLYTTIMERKLQAIYKYLDKNFEKEEQVMQFFKEVVEKVK